MTESIEYIDLISEHMNHIETCNDLHNTIDFNNDDCLFILESNRLFINKYY
jgi:hypothetical protein